jgi:hypothetical protein
MTVGSCAAGSADAIQAAAGIVVTIGNDVVALLRCEEITQPRAEITTDFARRTGTNDPPDNVLRTRQRAHVLKHEGAID